MRKDEGMTASTKLELPSIGVAPIAFCPLPLAFDLDLPSQVSYGHDQIYMQKVKVKGHSVQKSEWKQTGGPTEAIALSE